MTRTNNDNRDQRLALRARVMAVAAALCVCALLAGIGLTWSAYTGDAYLKGVEVTNATQSLFASDMLVGYYQVPTDDDAIDSRSVVVDTSSDTCSFTFRIYNCLLDDRQVVNDKDVPYTLGVTASGIADSEWSISPEDDSVTLPGNKATVKEYTITFPKSALGNVSFTVKATVDTTQTNIGTKLACLAAKIVPNEQSSVTAASVSGELVDKDGTFASYDAYNYRVTVTGVAAKVKVSWNADAVELDPFFSANHSDANIDAANGSATFTMEPGSAIINFYRSGSPSSWDDLDLTVVKVD